jgi:hypothetical protein
MYLDILDHLGTGIFGRICLYGEHFDIFLRSTISIVEKKYAFANNTQKFALFSLYCDICQDEKEDLC